MKYHIGFGWNFERTSLGQTWPNVAMNRHTDNAIMTNINKSSSESTLLRISEKHIKYCE